MTDSLYCEPCRRLLRGDLSVIDKHKYRIYFEHHNDRESLADAIRLPCAICSHAICCAHNTLSWADLAQQTRINGLLLYSEDDDVVTLQFMGEDMHKQNDYNSTRLALIPWSGTRDYSIKQDFTSTSASESTMKFMTDKLKDCRNNHVSCELPKWNVAAVYPARLLHVGTGPDSPVRLCEASSLHDEEYVCLSHCWGDVRLFMLNSETRSTLAQGIDLTMLPQTYQDAIHVTRRLRLEYIWIDSMCILQDNERDWAAESRRMGDIYANAACTIAATAAKDSRSGLFYERSAMLLQPRRVNFDMEGFWLDDTTTKLRLKGPYLCDTHYLAEKCIERAPLNQRAWVSQERQLSRRLLHFTGTQLFWECNEFQACETYPKGLPPWARSFWSADATALKRRVRDLMRGQEALPGCSALAYAAQSLDHKTYWAWLTFRNQYSKAALTYSTDKLVAIQGIVDWIRRVRDSQFIAGLWVSHIIEELCWWEQRGKTGPHQRSPPKPWRAPTWSWACSDADIQCSLLYKFHYKHANRRTEAAVVDSHAQLQMPEPSESALLKLRCRPLLAKFTYRMIELFDPQEEPVICISSRLGQQFTIQYSQDGGGETLFTPSEHTYIVILQRCLHQDHFEAFDGIELFASDETGRHSISEEALTVELPETLDVDCEADAAEALAIRAVDGAANQFERIGLFSLYGPRVVRKIMKAHCLAEEKVITLV